MPQHDMNIANQLFPPTRADLNNAFQALISNSSGASAPSVPVAAQWWADTANNVMKFRNNANDAWIELFTLDAGTIVQPVTIEAVPVGTIVAWPGLTVPDKWHLCDGSVLVRANYPGLFNVLGTRFNTGGETSAQFRLPDLRGRSIVGRDDMGGVAAGRVTQGVSGVNGLTIGATGGHQALQQHTHTGTVPHSHNLTDPGHFHFLTARVGDNPVNQAGGVGNPIGETARQTTTATTGITVNSATPAVVLNAEGTGTGQNMPPCMVMNWIIYTGGLGAPGDGGGGNVEPTLGNLEAIQFACSNETTALNTPGAVLTMRWPYEFVPTRVKATLNGACTTGTFGVSATVNGAPLFTTNVTIDATEKTSKTAAVPMVLALGNIPDDAEVIWTIENVGDSTATGLKITVYGYRVIN